MPPSTSTSEAVRGLREAHYNATIVDVRRLHDELTILRVEPDAEPLVYEPGQYTTLGLGSWEPRVAGCQPEDPAEGDHLELVKRAYSISSRLINDQGELVRPGTERVLEFYVSLVRQATPHPPPLTPRLFALEPGNRLFVGPKAHGRYTHAGVAEDDDVLFAATGTGEAPHNAMIAELLARGHRGRIASIVCVRFRKDLGYLAEHRELERRFDRFRYVPLTTREGENVDASRADFVGKLYVQDLFASPDFEERTGIALLPERTHVFLCGNPDMIGAPVHPRDSLRRFAAERGMVELLEKRGFTVDAPPHQPGNVHFEKYW